MCAQQQDNWAGCLGLQGNGYLELRGIYTSFHWAKKEDQNVPKKFARKCQAQLKFSTILEKLLIESNYGKMCIFSIVGVKAQQC